jgi:hypothetical protein
VITAPLIRSKPSEAIQRMKLSGEPVENPVILEVNNANQLKYVRASSDAEVHPYNAEREGFYVTPSAAAIICPIIRKAGVRIGEEFSEVVP